MSDTATADTSATEGPDATETETAETEDKALGEKGEKALEGFKHRARTAESALKAKEKEAQDLQARLEKLEDATKSEQEKAVERAKKEAYNTGKSESDSAWSQRVIRADVRGAARDRMTDPDDAFAWLDLSQFKVDENGDTDAKAIDKAINDLLKEKPYLAKQQKPSTGSADQGAKGSSGKALDMNALIRAAAGH